MLRGILSEGRDVTLVAAGMDPLPFIWQLQAVNLLNPRGGRSMRNCNTESAHTATCVLVGTATCLISRHTARSRAARSSGYVRKLSGRLD